MPTIDDIKRIYANLLKVDVKYISYEGGHTAVICNCPKCDGLGMSPTTLIQDSFADKQARALITSQHNSPRVTITASEKKGQRRSSTPVVPVRNITVDKMSALRAKLQAIHVQEE